MNVLVTGGDGFVGRHLCRELADRGHAVTAMSRDPDPAVLPDGVETVAGDVTDYDSIEGAFEGQDVVVNLVALSPLVKHRGTSNMEVHFGGTKNVVRAAEAHGVRRIVQMSALGLDQDIETDYLRAKRQAEDVVRGSDLEWVLVRPSIVFGEGAEILSFTKLVTTPYVSALPGGGKTPFQLVWIGDLAPMMADCVEDDDRAGHVYELGGPEVLTLADITRLVYRAEGKPTRIVPVPMALARLGMTAAGPVPFVPLGPEQARSLRIENVVRDNDVDAFGVEESELKTFDAFLGVEGT